MRRLTLVVLAGLSFLGAAPTARAGSKGKEPTVTEIGGKTLDQWISEISSKDRSKSERAIKTIVQFGPAARKAVPVLIAELKKHRPPGAILDLGVRVNAPVAISYILTTIDNPDPKLVLDAVAVLTAQLKDPQVPVRLRSIQALAQFGPAAQSALDELIPITREISTWETRQAAVIAVGMITPIDKQSGPGVKSVKALYASLDDSTYQVRLSALQGLQRLTVAQFPHLRPSLEKEVEALAGRDPEAVVRLRAHATLYGLRTDQNKTRIASIAKFLDHEEPEVRAEAAQGLGVIGPEAQAYVPALIRALGEREPNVVGASAWALGRMERAAIAALPLLEKIRKDEEQTDLMHQVVEEAINSITGKTKKGPPKGAGK